MKIYKHDYIFFIRLTIKRRGDKNLYIPLVETTLDKTEEMLRAAIRSATIDPLEKCNTTTIEMREATGGKNGAYRQLSFKGLSPQETFDLITDYINNIQPSALNARLTKFKLGQTYRIQELTYNMRSFTGRYIGTEDENEYFVFDDGYHIFRIEQRHCINALYEIQEVKQLNHSN